MMKQFRENVNAIISRNARHRVNEGVSEMESHGDGLNSNLEMRLVQMNVRKMKEQEKK
jgi:hypothetical protein